MPVAVSEIMSPIEAVVGALAAWIRADRSRRVAIERVDGQPVVGSSLEEPLLGAGFTSGLRGMELRGER